MRIIKMVVMIVVATCLLFLGIAHKATAQESNKGGSDDVICFLNNYTPRNAWNPDGSIRFGRPVNLEADLYDPASQVSHVVFSMMPSYRKGSQIESGSSRTLTWTPSETGDWTVVAQLFDSNGQEVYPQGDCHVEITIAGDASAYNQWLRSMLAKATPFEAQTPPARSTPIESPTKPVRPAPNRTVALSLVIVSFIVLVFCVTKGLVHRREPKRM